MCDKSDYTLKEKSLASVWINKRSQIGKLMKLLRDDFQQRFRKETPPKQALLIMRQIPEFSIAECFVLVQAEPTLL